MRNQKKERIENAVRNSKIPVLDKSYYEGIKAFYSVHQYSMKRRDAELFEEFLSYPNCNFVKRIIFMIRRKYKVNNSVCYLLAKCLIRKFIY